MMTRGPVEDPLVREFTGLEVMIVEAPDPQGGFATIADDDPARAPKLTHAEREVLEGLLCGLRLEQIAERRGTSEILVWSQVARIFRAFGVVSRGELLVRCRGLLQIAY